MILVALAAAWLAGTYLGIRFDATWPAIAMFATASVLLMVLARIGRRSMLPALMLLVLALSIARVALSGGDESELVAYHGSQPLQIEGVVVSDPEAAGAATRFRLAVERVTEEDGSEELSGDVLVTARESRELVRAREAPYFRYGDRLRLEGVLEEPPVLEDFDYPTYLARQGIGSVMSFPKVAFIAEGQGNPFYRWLYGVRRRLARSLAAVVPEPQASVGQALLLGLRDRLPDELVDEFRATGTSHILAISGLHVAVLLGVSLAASQWLLGRRRHLYLLAPLTLLWLYALISGMSPSVTRAAIMGTVYLAALFLGRPRSVFPALAFAAAVMVALNPQVLWSVSFQLSFAAVAGIALMAEPIAGRLKILLGARPDEGISPPPPVGFLAYIAATTVAAIVATIPLIAFHFQSVALVGLPASVLVLPLLPFVLVTQAVAGAVGVASEVVATPLGWIAWLSTKYVTTVVSLFARIPVASVETGRMGVPLVWAYYGVFVLGYLVVRYRNRARRVPGTRSLARSSLSLPRVAVPWWVLLPAIAGVALLWLAVVSRPDGRLHVAFIDVGQGDSVHITTPSGVNILVDGGPDPLEAVRAMGSRMSFMDRGIELVALTHPHGDHVTGLLEVLRRYDVGHILERRSNYGSSAYESWRQAVEEEDAQVIQAQPGQVIATDDGVFIEVIGPPARLLGGTRSDVDNASVVVRLVYGRVSFLLTGDIFAQAEDVLVARGAHIDSDVLKVPHHGSRSSSSKEFLSRVTPSAAVISAGVDNRFGHPHGQTLAALESHLPADALFSTAERGTIEFVTDGRRLEVKTER